MIRFSLDYLYQIGSIFCLYQIGSIFFGVLAGWKVQDRGHPLVISAGLHTDHVDSIADSVFVDFLTLANTETAVATPLERM